MVGGGEGCDVVQHSPCPADVTEGQTQDPDQDCIRSSPTAGHQPSSVPGTGHRGQGNKAECGLLTLEEGGNMNKILLTPSRVKSNL